MSGCLDHQDFAKILPLVVMKNFPLLVAVNLVLTAVSIVLTPWSSIFITMLIVHFTVAVTSGTFETAIQAEEVSRGKGSSDSAMQFLSFSFSFGGIVGPLVTKPFLSQKVDDDILSNNSIQNGSTRYSIDLIDSVVSTIVPISSKSNKSFLNETIGKNLDQFTSSESNDIHYAFLITAIHTVFASIPFFVMSFCSFEDKKAIREKKRQPTQATKRLPQKVYFFLVAVGSALFFLYAATDDNFSQYLAYFLNKHLDWSKEHGALVSSLYWGTSCFVKVILVLIALHVNGGIILLVSSIGMVISSVMFIIASMFHINSLVWVSTACLASSSAAMWGGGIAWIDTNFMRVDGKVTSALMITASLGAMTIPMPLGILMKDVTLMTFPFMTFALNVLILLIFVCMLFVIKPIITRKYGPPLSRREKSLDIKAEDSSANEENDNIPLHLEDNCEKSKPIIDGQIDKDVTISTGQIVNGMSQSGGEIHQLIPDEEANKELSMSNGECEDGKLIPDRECEISSLKSEEKC